MQRDSSPPPAAQTAPGSRTFGHVPEYDGLRGVLASWVCVTHIVCWSGFSHWNLPNPISRVWATFIFAQPAVQVFIILSGFAITALIQSKSPTYREFIKGRFFRIVPVYAVCLFLGACTVPLTAWILKHAPWNDSGYFALVRPLSNSERTALWPHLLSHGTLLHGLIPKPLLENSSGTILGPAWSISLEWQYYLVAPALGLLVRSVAGGVAIGLVAFLGSRYGAAWENPHLAFLPAQLPLFVIGIGSYHLRKYCLAVPQKFPLISCFVVITIVFAVLTRWHTVALTLWALCFGCCLIREAEPVNRVLAPLRAFLMNGTVQSLGKMSYPLYLIHWPLIVALLGGLLMIHPAASRELALLVMMGLGLPVILLMTFLLHHYVETPLMMRGKLRAKARSETQ